jgi:hypothetical protein
LGSKNRIFIGIITSLILHHIRNVFNNRIHLYITKHKSLKIKKDHPKEYEYLMNDFQIIIDHTIGYCLYEKQKNLYNFVSLYENSYYIYSISTNNHYLETGTFFRASKTRLRKCKKENIRFFKDSQKETFMEYLN